MPRALDEPIPPGERLFLRLEPALLEESRVLPAAIHIQGGCSLNREKYMPSVPFDVLLPRLRPDQCCIAGARAANVPVQTLEDGAKRMYLFALADNPVDAEGKFPANSAHAEIRVVRAGMPYDPAAVLPRPVKKSAQALIAKAFTKCYQPTLAEGRCPAPDDAQWVREVGGVEVTLP